MVSFYQVTLITIFLKKSTIHKTTFPSDRKATENKILVEFELAVAFDVQGVQLPRRQIIQNVCPWKYKGPECGYVPGGIYNSSDQPVSQADQDVCGKRVNSCKLRFGTYAELPYGGFPAAGMTK